MIEVLLYWELNKGESVIYLVLRYLKLSANTVRNNFHDSGLAIHHLYRAVAFAV